MKSRFNFLNHDDLRNELEQKERTILVIDDHQENLDLLRDIMESLFPKVRVLTTLSGMEGVRLCKAEKPDIVLLDIVMPQMDGFMVCRKIKEDESLKGIPVLMFTSHDSENESRVKALEMGADAFISRPFNEPELIAQVRAMFRIHDSEVDKSDERERLEQLVKERTAELEQALSIRKNAEKQLSETLNKLEKSMAVETTLLKNLQKEIEDRKHLEHIIRESELKYRTLSENLPDVIARFDRSYRHTFVNRVIEKISGLPPEYYIGKRNDELDTVQTNTTLWESSLKEVFDTGNEKEIEFQYSTTRGELYFAAVLVPEFNDEGEVQSVLSVARNITDRKGFENEIQKNNLALDNSVKERTLQLEMALKELESFSYSVSHDLRAPLRGIDGWSLALLEDFGEKMDGVARAHLNRVRAEVQHMSRLIDGLLKLSRLSRSEMVFSTIDLSKIATRLLQEFKEEYPKRVVHTSIQEDVFCYGDSLLMEQLMTNLFQNAWKFTQLKEIAEISFGYFEEDGWNTYYVKDNGAGFDMKYVHKLFGAFQRLHSVSEFPGTGIGLATVQRIIHRHEGFVWAEGIEGEGSTFYFKLKQKKDDTIG